MKSRTTKLVSAAVIVAAIIISLSQFNQPVVKAVEFSEMNQAMQRVPWMHLVGSGFGPGFVWDEQWVNFQSKVLATRSGRNVTFLDLREHRKAEFDPNSNRIASNYVDDREFPSNIPSPAAFVESVHKMLKQQGAKIVTRMGDYKGLKVQIQEITLTREGGNGETQRVVLHVDPATKLLYLVEAKAIDSTGKIIAAGSITVDYPSSGPQSIYDLGVPRDAKVGDNGPQPSFQSIIGQYERARAEATREYIAVTATHRSLPAINDVVTTILVEYKSGRKQRWEAHDVLDVRSPYISAYRLWPTYREQLGDSLESLLAWTQSRLDDPPANIQVSLYDGQYYGLVYGRVERGWSEVSKTYLPSGVSPTDCLANLGWPVIMSPSMVIEDDYARQNGLVCIETLRQGHVASGGGVSLPGRFLYYLDPARDYLCRRRVTEERPKADWQQDKNWLGAVDPNKAGNGSIAITDIPEVTQAQNGHWYPKTVVARLGGDRKGYDYKNAPFSETTEKVYLAIPPKFPEGIFDIDKLPGQSTGPGRDSTPVRNGPGATLQEERDQVDSFNRASAQFHATIEKREVWPDSPVAVCKAFWTARAKKDYAEMEVLWLASASVNWPQICKSDPNVEYVFGEASPDGTQVPYATQDYFDTNHTYNLTMRLSAINTDKGLRYCIVSGN